MQYWFRMLLAAIVGGLERTLYRVAAFALALVGFAIVLGLVSSLVARIGIVPMAEGRLDEQWGDGLDSVSSLPQRFLAHEANPKALEVEKLAAEIGLDLVPAGSGRQISQSEAAERFAAHRQALVEYARALVQARGESLPAAQSEIRPWLASARNGVEHLVAAVLESTEPRWECDLEAGPDFPVPGLEGELDLQRVLIAEAVNLWQRGNKAALEKRLDASWRLNETGMNRAERTSFLATLEVLDLQMAVIRRMEAVPSGWIERLESLQLASRYLETVQAEAWRAMVKARTMRMTNLGRPWAALAHPLVQPFQRLAMLDAVDALRWGATELPLRDMASFERGVFAAELHGHVPRWNGWAGRELPEIGSGWLATVRASLGVELTLRVLSLREVAVGRQPSQLAQLFAGEQAAQVRGLSWIYTVDLNQATIALDREPYPHLPEDMAVLPLVYTMDLSTRGRRGSGNG
jgi:hypothetical protein